MSKELYLHTLQQIRDGCLAENMDTEAEALEAAIQALSCDEDCISRQAAKRALEEGRYSTGYCKEHGIDHSISMEMVRILLNDLPSAQPEIIRCKDCSKWKTIHCPFFSKYITVMPNEEQYCSYAERRTDGKP